MDERKRERLEAAGWRVGTVQEFLGLTDEESAVIEQELVCKEELKRQRPGWRRSPDQGSGEHDAA